MRQKTSKNSLFRLSPSHRHTLIRPHKAYFVFFGVLLVVLLSLLISLYTPVKAFFIQSSPSHRQIIFLLSSTCLLSFTKKYNILSKSSEHFPYKLARIVEGKKKYIEYWIWSIEKRKLLRRRIYKNISLLLVEKINNKLRTGNAYEASDSELERDKAKTAKRNEKAVVALKKSYEAAILSMRNKSTNSYKTHVNLFCNFLDKNYPDILLVDIDRELMHEFLNYYQIKKNWSGRTRNAYVQNISTIMNKAVDIGYLEKNIFTGFPQLKAVKVKAHRAYNVQQRQQLKKVISKENPQLWLMCVFLFYTYARPNEIRQLKVGYIEIENNKIFIPAEISKNGQDGRVDIPLQLRQLLIDNKIFDYTSDNYILGKEGRPSPNFHPRYAFSKKYKIFRDRLGLAPDFTLYSWKHTGVSEAYKNGIDLLEISKQCRHWDLNETRTYLRSLGVYSSEKIQNNFPDL